MPSISPLVAEGIHPALWRASQLARGHGAYLDTGFPELRLELPGGGWPLGQLTEILLPTAGIAELSLLKPALNQLQGRPIVLLTPPYTPQALALSCAHLETSQLIWITCSKQSNALWAAEQVLRNGSCGALLFWQSQIRSEALRRLHLAAQSSDTFFCLMRSLQMAPLPSPAPLRLSLRPVAGGLELAMIKRRGGLRDRPLTLRIAAHHYLYSHAHTNKENSTADRHAGAMSATLARRTPAHAPA